MKIAIIGLGDIAQKAYLPVLTQLEGIELIFCTRNAQVLSQLSSQYRVAQYCHDYREVISFNPDAVMIHAATAVHHQIASFFLAQGVPTFVDKPLADSADQVESLYALAEKHQQPLYVGFNRRHIPLYNQHLPELASAKPGNLTSLRWEKHRLNLPGDIRTFVFDDFIHPLDSINLDSRTTLDQVYITKQFDGAQLARLDVQWQAGQTLLHASMNRQFGTTKERVSATYTNQAYEFDSFYQGQLWCDGENRTLALKDWTPMLTSKGFETMILDWLAVVESGTMPIEVVARNVASHRLADCLVAHLEAQLPG
ncbi:Gfo/Idh/MocA family oxidoreductase [Vibrio sp. JPW-9-11-11]|uniref:Gfo/Idh/MocA family protein n=1 Tax=Vibrio sp. JPW-9-11-11 TaxID=1416532 RepID=UPI001592F786|nr:Gfo/Idh/MocA family oxidoreductase [Vibrio sp. JPW-9-11-11]NVD08549.1 Gfo/Idh/MocA family oxidoreductase [Vibrio sp. JPW-9-11-11]